MENLKEKIKKGIQFSIIEKIVLFTFGIVQLIIVVRYIDEGEIGLMALANTILTFAAYFSEAGMSASIIHSQSANREQLSSIFWLQILMGAIIYFILLLLSHPIAIFFEAPILQKVISIIGITVFINSLGQSYGALLYRSLYYKLLSSLRITVNFFNFCIVCFLAIRGYGIWALVSGALGKSMIQVFLYAFYGKKLFVPICRLNIKEIRSNINFGLFQTGELLVNTINKELDTLIIGKLLGEEVLGIYDTIKQLLSRLFKTVNTVSTQVLLPVFAKLQDKKSKVSKLYLLQIRFLSSINFPIYFFIAFHASFLFSHMLQPEWNTAQNQQLVFYFCLYFQSYSIQNPIGTLLVSHGRVKQSFWYNIFFTVILPPILFWGAQSGIVEILQFLCILMTLRIFSSYHYLLKPMVDFGFMQYLLNITSPFLLSGFCAFSTNLLSHTLPVADWIRLLLSLFLFGFLYLIGSYYMNRPTWKTLYLLMGTKNFPTKV